MKKYILLPMLLIGFFVQQSIAKVEVVASLTDLASIAAAVGGDHVDVVSIARATADPHSVEVLPSYMVRVSRADLYLKVGLGLDRWADGIIDGSRNSRLRIADCSLNIHILEVPTTKVTAAQGDVHPDGNPHYWLDPRNGIQIARTIHRELIALDPSHREAYDANLEAFVSLVESKFTPWSQKAAALSVHEIITYHSSWSYFADAFGLDIAAQVEPVPGIPPTASHLAGLVDIIRERGIAVLIQEPYFSNDAPKYLARETGVRLAELSPSCDGASAQAYTEHFEQIFAALQGTGQ